MYEMYDYLRIVLKSKINYITLYYFLVNGEKMVHFIHIIHRHNSYHNFVLVIKYGVLYGACIVQNQTIHSLASLCSLEYR